MYLRIKVVNFFCKEIQNRKDICTAVLQMYDKIKE